MIVVSGPGRKVHALQSLDPGNSGENRTANPRPRGNPYCCSGCRGCCCCGRPRGDSADCCSTSRREAHLGPSKSPGPSRPSAKKRMRRFYPQPPLRAKLIPQKHGSPSARLVSLAARGYPCFVGGKVLKINDLSPANPRPRGNPHCRTGRRGSCRCGRPRGDSAERSPTSRREAHGTCNLR